MIEDSGTPLSIVSENWMMKYIEEKVVSKNELEYRNLSGDSGLQRMYWV